MKTIAFGELARSPIHAPTPMISGLIDSADSPSPRGRVMRTDRVSSARFGLGVEQLLKLRALDSDEETAGLYHGEIAVVELTRRV